MALVLVIDDDAAMRQMLRRILTSGGHQVIEAGNGVEGLTSAQERRPDLIMTDILMPEKDGIETIRDIHRLVPGSRIIAMSGGGRIRTGHYLEVAGKLGADVVLEKPFRAALLLETVERILTGDAPSRAQA